MANSEANEHDDDFMLLSSTEDWTQVHALE